MRHLFPLPLALLIAGCGPDAAQPTDTRPDITVRGRLVNGPKPWVLDEGKAKPAGGIAPPVAPGQENAAARMEFVSSEGNWSVSAALNTSDGTFVAKGLKAGRYKIALTGGGFAPNGPDPFGGKFTRDKTQIVRDLRDGDDLTLDVSKPGG